MNFQFWLRRYLGIDALEMQAHQLKCLSASNLNRLDGIEHNTRIHSHALARVIAKIEPAFGVHEDDPERKAASNKLGEDIIKRLGGEIMAQRKHP